MVDGSLCALAVMFEVKQDPTEVKVTESTEELNVARGAGVTGPTPWLRRRLRVAIMRGRLGAPTRNEPGWARKRYATRRFRWQT